MSKKKKRKNEKKSVMKENEFNKWIAIIGLFFSLFSLFFSYQANQTAKHSNRMEVENFNFDKLDLDVEVIQHMHKKYSENTTTIFQEDKEIISRVYQGLTQHIDLYSLKEGTPVRKKGEELKLEMEQYIFSLYPELSPEFNNNKENNTIIIPKTGSIPSLEVLLSEFKILKKQYILDLE